MSGCVGMVMGVWISDKEVCERVCGCGCVGGGMWVCGCGCVCVGVGVWVCGCVSGCVGVWVWVEVCERVCV